MSAYNRGYDNHLIVMSHYNITPQVQSYDIPPGHIILPTGQPVFALNYPLYVECLTRKLQLPIWNIWLDSAGNRTRVSQTRSERSNNSDNKLVFQSGHLPETVLYVVTHLPLVTPVAVGLGVKTFTTDTTNIPLRSLCMVWVVTIHAHVGCKCVIIS